MMKRRPRQSGEGNVGCIIWAAIFAIVIFIGWKAVPIKINSAELYDFMDDQARYTKKGKEEKVKDVILGKARKLELPLDEDHLSVTRVQDIVTIEYEYTVYLEFPGYTYEWAFADTIERSVFVY